LLQILKIATFGLWKTAILINRFEIEIFNFQIAVLKYLILLYKVCIPILSFATSSLSLNAFLSVSFKSALANRLIPIFSFYT